MPNLQVRPNSSPFGVMFLFFGFKGDKWSRSTSGLIPASDPVWFLFCHHADVFFNGHYILLLYCGGGNTTEPGAERQRELVTPEGLRLVCHCARAICPVTDPWTQSLQVNCDSLLGVCARARACVSCGCGRLHQCICIPSPPMPAAVSLHLPPDAECRRAGVESARALPLAANEMSFR